MTFDFDNMPENTAQFWYIIKQENGTCAIVELNDNIANTPKQSGKSQWGAFASEQEAIAKKIGLIRAGKCKPQ